MVSPNRITGYLLVGRRAKRGFESSDIALYQAVANHAAMAIEIARMVTAMGGWIDVQTREVVSFRALAENAMDAVCMATLGDHRLIYANQAYYEMYGYDENDEVIGLPDDSFLVYDEAHDSTTKTKVTRVGGLRREHIHTRKDGSKFVGMDTVFAVRDESGAIALGNVIRDITRQKELELRLRDLSDRRTWQLAVITQIAQELSAAPEMEELLRRIVTLIKERFNYYHTHLYFVKASGELELAEGYGEPGRLMKEHSHRILLGKGLVGTAAQFGKPVLAPDVSQRDDWLPNDLLPNTRSEIAVPIKMGDEILGVLDVQSDKVNGLTEDDQSLLLGLCGQIAVAIQNARMVGNIQQLVDERTREVTIFYSLAENATYGVLMTTPEGTVTYANRANHQMFRYGYSEGMREMIGMSISQFFTPDVVEQFAEQVPDLLAGKSWQIELDGMRKDGSKLNLLMLAFAILDDLGEPLAIVFILRDMTEQKQLEAERERLDHDILAAHERLITELSAPLIPITEGILVLPLIGTVGSIRAQHVMESLLQGVENYDAETVLIDVTGVPVMDTSVANHLIQMTDAAGLLGARVVLVGITPQVAQTIVELGVDLSSITTRSNLQGGVEYALRLQGQRIASVG
jgi:PAS domain S-box-containing protein